jgi:hypothetical protein
MKPNMRFVFALFVFVTTAIHADLFMQEQTVFDNQTNFDTTRIHGNKIREDTTGGEAGDVSRIEDASTGDCILLLHRDKIFRKTSGAHIRERLEYFKKQYGETSASDAAPKKLADTGKSEKISGQDAKIFNWPVVDGSSMTYWIAKDFPDYKKIKADLAVTDQFRAQGLGKGLQPDLGKLPGMVIKLQIVLNGALIDRTNALITTSTLISAKKEPVDPSIFEIPSDYKESISTNSSDQSLVTPTRKE